MGIFWNLVMNRFFGLVRKDYDSVYAEPVKSGTYVAGPRCPKCKLATRKRASLLTIEWERGSSVIGDFTWINLEELIVADQVRTCFVSSGFTGVEFEPIEMVQKRGLKKPRKVSKAQNRVWLPYDGPSLWNLIVTSSCDINLTLTSRSLVTECDSCKRQRMIVHDSAAPLVVKPESWEGTDFFCIREMGKLVFVTEEVKQKIEEQKFTNVKIAERGYVENA